eukprot:363412-Chlamydomonas_euryale.AAC.7
MFGIRGIVLFYPWGHTCPAHTSSRPQTARLPCRSLPATAAWRTAVRYWLRRAASSARHQDRGGQRRRGGGPNRLRPSTWWDRTA